MKGRVRVAPVDVTIALALAAGAELEVWRFGLVQGPKLLQGIFLLLITLPIAFRRTAPLVVIVINLAAADIQSIVVGAPHDIASLLAVVVVVFSVARYSSSRQAIAGAALAAMGLVIYEIPALAPLPAVVVWIFAGASWTIGTLMRELADLNRTLEDRVRRQVDELARLSRLRRFLPPQLAQLVVSSGDESFLDSHRRDITVLFCDIRGFTAFAETTEPELVMTFLRQYHAAMGEIIFKYEGTLKDIFGDGLMVFFNDPFPAPDHNARAVRLAIDMRESAMRLLSTWNEQGHELGFGLGIASGEATLGWFGPQGRIDYGAVGSPVNLAARLCAAASTGQILVTEAIHDRVEYLVEIERIGLVRLKGFRHPAAVWNVRTLRALAGAPT